MKWINGDTEWWQKLAADPRYTVTKATDVDPPKYGAWYTPNGVGSWQSLCESTTDYRIARKAAETHYSAMQRSAA